MGESSLKRLMAAPLEHMYHIKNVAIKHVSYIPTSVTDKYWINSCNN